MASILQLRHLLIEEPQILPVPGVELRTFAGPEDVEIWLDLRHRSFAGQRVGIGQWTEADFEREFLTKPWWKPEQLWFAEVPDVIDASRRAIGTVTLAQRGSGDMARPAVHWLAVLPRWRRRGVARLLMSAVHREAWMAGGREVVLETHSGWTAAAGFYESMGYRSAE
ncbi:MAG TPA: GNAT family N-acetyltransferase [Pirellulales bacterium]|nr:GNAT family N-acetyltransferase [Pirellulales bacterium]